MQDLEFRQLVEGLKLRSPIEVVVGERVSDLKKAGSIFKARCPFHEERTPSFTVDPRRGTWRCWGACGEGGDVISFIERFDGVSFQDALRLLAHASGEELPEALFRKGGRRGKRKGGDESQEELLYDILRRARDLYRRELFQPAGADALAYARDRGLSDESIETFGLGWAPRDGSPLLEAATRAGIGVDPLMECGLVNRSESGRSYDFFRGRLMVPIADRMGRTVGFGGRVLPADSTGSDGRPVAKYVNTRETPLFHKGRLVYALDLAANAVRRSHHLVLVEGYTDVIAAHQAGHRNVAAVLGTSTTSDHAALVRRSGARRVTLVFDGDAAGRQASLRALTGLLSLEVELDVVVLPKGTDPCDLLVSADGGERFGEMLAAAKDWFAWSLDGLEGADGRAIAQGVDELFGLVSQLSRPVERAMRLREIAATLRIPEDDLRLQWQDFMASRSPDTRRAAARVAAPAPSAEEPPGDFEPDYDHEPDFEPELEAAPPDPGTLQAFENLLGALLLDNSLIPMYAELESRCPRGELATIFRAVLDLYDHAEDDELIHAGRVLTVLGEDPARRRVVELEERAKLATSAAELARDQERWLDARDHERELATLGAALARSVHAFDGSQAAEDVLRSLHEKLKNQRVPETPSSEAAPSS